MGTTVYTKGNGTTLHLDPKCTGSRKWAPYGREMSEERIAKMQKEFGFKWCSKCGRA